MESGSCLRLGPRFFEEVLMSGPGEGPQQIGVHPMLLGTREQVLTGGVTKGATSRRRWPEGRSRAVGARP